MKNKIAATAAVALLCCGGSADAGSHKSVLPAKGNPASWASDEDADSSVFQNGGGMATVEYDITADGRAANCRVVKLTGNPTIGNFICKLMLRRARYVPGKTGTGSYTMGWND